jgi:hypothetical protein
VNDRREARASTMTDTEAYADELGGRERLSSCIVSICALVCACNGLECLHQPSAAIECVRTHGALGSSAVTGSHSTEDRRVFHKRRVQIWRHEVRIEPLVSVEPRLKEVNHRAKRRSGAGIVQRRMERLMTLEYDVVIEHATVSGLPKRGMSRSHLSGQGLPRCKRESVYSSRDDAVERADGLIEILGVGGSHRRRSDSWPRAAAIDHQQPFGQQPTDCFTHGSAAHVQLGGKRGFRCSGPGSYVPPNQQMPHSQIGIGAVGLALRAP